MVERLSTEKDLKELEIGSHDAKSKEPRARSVSELAGGHWFESSLPNKSASTRRFKRFELRWNEPLGKSECPYMHRWVIGAFGYSVRIHKWHRSDDKRSFHDHAWNFLTIVLVGGYQDHSPGGIDRLRTGSIRYRRATHKHYVEIPAGGATTLIFAGKPIRQWGFWIAGKFIKRRQDYFEKYGHPPCSEQ